MDEWSVADTWKDITESGFTKNIPVENDKVLIPKGLRISNRNFNVNSCESDNLNFLFNKPTTLLFSILYQV